MLCNGVPMLLFIYYYGQIAVKLKIQFDWLASETGKREKTKCEDREGGREGGGWKQFGNTNKILNESLWN